MFVEQCRALGDPVRWAIVRELQGGTRCACVLAQIAHVSAPLLSHHLKVLSDAGLVNARRDRVDGRWVYYSVNRAAVAQWRSWFADFLDPTRIQERMLCGPEGQGQCQ